MPAEIDSSRPLAPDGTTDWEAVFEDADTGPIPLIVQAHSTESLKACTIAALGMLLVRKNDDATMKRLNQELDRIIAEGGEGAEGLDVSRSAITDMLRRIKDSRKQKATLYVANKKLKTNKNRRAADTDDTDDTIAGTPASVGTPVGKTVAQGRRRRLLYAASAALAVGLAALIWGLNEAPDSKSDGMKEAAWVQDYVSAHLPDETWELASVRPREGEKITLEVQVTDPRHVDVIKGVPRMARVQFLKSICPPQESGVKFVIENGWTLWVSLKNGDELLTGGSCHY